MHVVKKLPAAPQILARLGQLRLDPNAALEDVTALLRCDAALTARILRIANSPAYAARSTYGSLAQAVARVGFGEIYKIAGLATVAQMADQDLRLYGITGRELRENSLLTALIMEELAWSARADPQEAYSAGLLRSTGKVVLEILMADSPLRTAYEHVGGSLHEWETRLTGMSNCNAAAFILTEWRFPASIVSAIGNHYVPADASPRAVLTSILHLAACAADGVGAGLRCEVAYWDSLSAECAAAGIGEDRLTGAVEVALGKLRDLRPAIS